MLFNQLKIVEWVSTNYAKQPDYFKEAQVGVVLHFLKTRGSFEANGSIITAKEVAA